MVSPWRRLASARAKREEDNERRKMLVGDNEVARGTENMREAVIIGKSMSRGQRKPMKPHDDECFCGYDLPRMLVTHGRDGESMG